MRVSTSQVVQSTNAAFERLFELSTRLRTLLALGGIVLGLVAVWGAAYASGGSRTVLPHLFYFPIVLSSVRFGWLGAVTSASIAGLLAGPALPADVENQVVQPVWGWVLRLAMFLGVATLVAWLSRHRSESVTIAVQDARLSGKLRQALRDGEIVVYYQPILDMESGRIVGVEALARWKHPTEGLLPPDYFIPPAERTGMIAQLDRYVLREAIREVSAWSSSTCPLRVSVNVSATRFAERNLVGDVGTALSDFGMAPQQLQLEMTETAIIQDVVASATQIAALRGIGVTIAIDDFGVGQTSLSYLHQFTVDTVKIDRSFVAKTPADPKAARLVAGMIRLLEAIGTKVVGEGISNAEEYVQMRSLGCKLGQGFYIGRPAPAAETEQLIVKTHERLARRTRP